MRTGICKVCNKTGALVKDTRICRECHNAKEREKRKLLRNSPNCPYWLSREGRRESARKLREKKRASNPAKGKKPKVEKVPKEKFHKAKIKAEKDVRHCRQCGIEVPRYRQYCDACRDTRRKERMRRYDQTRRQGLWHFVRHSVRLSRSETSKGYRERHPEKAKHSHRVSTWKKAGITDINDARRVWESEDICAICGTREGRFVVDHDHRTGKVRGKLCSKCNRALGHFDDRVDLILKAAAYLTASQGLKVSRTKNEVY